MLSAYQRLQGNYLQPFLGGRGGHNAFLLQDLWRCLSLVRSAEAMRGAAFRYVGFARFDMHWLALPPSLAQFEAVDPHAIWILDGMDWSGINDRFALVPRRWADAYFSRWPLILNGTLLWHLWRAVPAASILPSHDFYGGPEWSLLAMLGRHKVQIKRLLIFYTFQEHMVTSL